ncbi:MAG: hypothetical protein ACI85O_003761, partial [Saprospiraceae bacterium]
NSSVATAMQRFFEENYRKNLSLKFIHINNVTYLVKLTKKDWSYHQFFILIISTLPFSPSDE